MIKVKTIREWCEDNLSPRAWQRIKIRLLPEFRKEGHFLHTLGDDITLSNNLVAAIGQTIKDIYQKTLPTQFNQSQDEASN